MGSQRDWDGEAAKLHVAEVGLGFNPSTVDGKHHFLQGF